MKIFEIEHSDGEKEWVSGETNLDAINTYVSTTQCSLYDLKDSEIREVPKSKYSKYRIAMEVGVEISFKTWMRDNHLRSEIICGTMYDF